MLTLVLALVVSASTDDAPAPPTTSDPPAVAEEPEPAPTDACRDLLRAGKKKQAATCYRAVAPTDIVDLVSALELDEPKLEAPDRLALGELVSSGKAEMIGVSTLAGAYVAVLGVSTLFYAAGPSNAGSTEVALLLLAPVVGGGIALAASTGAVVAIPELTAGDANIIRAGILLGSFNSAMFPIDRLVLARDSVSSPFGALDTFAMAGLVVAGAAGGTALAATTDLPESAGSFALSSGLWTTVVTLLLADMGPSLKHPENGVFIITAAGNIGFVGGLVASPYLPMSRAETWAVDVGGGVGLAAGASVATFARAPNPFLGYGTMLIGTTVGMATGFAAARYLPDAFGALPQVVAIAPLAVPEASRTSHASVVYGGALVGRF